MARQVGAIAVAGEIEIGQTIFQILTDAMPPSLKVIHEVVNALFWCAGKIKVVWTITGAHTQHVDEVKREALGKSSIDFE